MSLTPRAELLLKALIERYIAEGQPVGSRTLSKQTALDLSPATIRNIMADLEELGLIRAPHTSAGRVPTELGYRMFVDTLLKVQPLRASELHRIEGELAAEQDAPHIIETASSLLSQITKLAGVVTVPKREQAAFRQLEFLSLSPSRVLAILVTQDGGVHNRVIHVDKPYSPAELVQAANFFNETYAGMTLTEVKRALLSAIQRDSEDMQRIMRAAVVLAHQMFADEKDSGEDLVVRGESNLLEIPELGDVNKLRKLFDAFNTKRDLLHLLDQSMRVGGIQIFIGSESGYQPLQEFSVVASSYKVDGRIVGTLGVVGPTRMAYEQVISIVDVTARLLSGALSGERVTEPPH
ncbi:MAG TPA: heat-inducible transcriptional repressor HrcA [Acidiferrobacterales bacterium]|nr:heat-inducible transcriptional repressor HrcA [Acidiferrobacterales bacterium]